MAFINGTNANDNITGTANNDQIFARSGNDFVFGRNGNDLILGEAGNDALDGEAGNDNLRGGDGIDFLYGGAGNDTLIGDTGNDTFLGGTGNDLLIWNNGDGSDTIRGEAGTDVVVVNGSTTAGDNFLLNRNGAQAIFSRTNLTPFTLNVDGVEQFEVNGGEGDDRLEVRELSGTEVDLVTFSGGAGNDTFDASDRFRPTVSSGGTGNDSLIGGTGTDTLEGDNGNDTLQGGAGNDFLLGGDGNDNLFGGPGNDRLNGGAGNDTLTGGAGSNDFVFNSGAAFNTADVGVDTINNFTSGIGDIILDRTTFTVLTGAGEIAVVANDSVAPTSSAFIVYSSATGKLFYNQDGADIGFGSGAQFATLTGAPVIVATDFLIQA